MCIELLTSPAATLMQVRVMPLSRWIATTRTTRIRASLPNLVLSINLLQYTLEAYILSHRRLLFLCG